MVHEKTTRLTGREKSIIWLNSKRSAFVYALAGLAAGMFSATPSHAFVYELCIGIEDVSESGTDDEGLKAVFQGTYGNSDWVSVSQAGDDLNRNTVSCFNFDANRTDVKDNGFINQVLLNFSGGDDFCINKVTVAMKPNAGAAATNTEAYDQVGNKKCMGNESYSSTRIAFTARRPMKKSTFGDGDWLLVCQNRCGLTEIQEKSQKTTTENNLTSRELTEIAASFSYEYKGNPAYEASGSVSARNLNEMIQETKTKIESGTSNTLRRDLTLTPAEMKDNKINAMWVWAIGADVGRGNFNIRSNKIVCTSTVARPSYGPFSEEGALTCNGKLTGG